MSSPQDFPDGSMAWNYPLLVALRFAEWPRLASLEREAPEPWGAKWVYGGRLKHQKPLGRW